MSSEWCCGKHRQMRRRLQLHSKTDSKPHRYRNSRYVSFKLGWRADCRESHGYSTRVTAWITLPRAHLVAAVPRIVVDKGIYHTLVDRFMYRVQG
jgi:hypothetical protein